MQTTLQKIGQHFENMVSTSGGAKPPRPPIYQPTRLYILSMMRTSLKQPANSNRDCVATSEAYQTPLNERQTLW